MSRYAPPKPGTGLWYVLLPAGGALPPWPKDRDRFIFLALLRREMAERGAACVGYCLLNRAAHLLAAAGAEEATAAVGAAMRRYARYWRGWYAPRRRVFRPARAASIPESLAWDALAHLETEPVRAGLCGTAECYRWSSGAAHAGWGPCYMPLHLEEWSVHWTCGAWRGRLESWGSDLWRARQILRLLERAAPLRAAVEPAECSPPPLLLASAEVARAAAARA